MEDAIQRVNSQDPALAFEMEYDAVLLDKMRRSVVASGSKPLSSHSHPSVPAAPRSRSVSLKYWDFQLLIMTSSASIMIYVTLDIAQSFFITRIARTPGCCALAN